MRSPVRSYGERQPKVTPAAVEQAADELFHSGTPPTVRNVRERLGGGALTTLTPLVRAWWNALPNRVSSAATTDDPPTEPPHPFDAREPKAPDLTQSQQHSAPTTEASRPALEPPRSMNADGAPFADLAAVISRLEQDLAEFKQLWREERAGRRAAERHADRLRAELLRLIIATRDTSARHRRMPFARPRPQRATSRKTKSTRSD